MHFYPDFSTIIWVKRARDIRRYFTSSVNTEFPAFAFCFVDATL